MPPPISICVTAEGSITNDPAISKFPFTNIPATEGRIVKVLPTGITRDPSVICCATELIAGIRDEVPMTILSSFCGTPFGDQFDGFVQFVSTAPVHVRTANAL